VRGPLIAPTFTSASRQSESRQDGVEQVQAFVGSNAKVASSDVESTAHARSSVWGAPFCQGAELPCAVRLTVSVHHLPGGSSLRFFMSGID
jgi:hypothetical protein